MPLKAALKKHVRSFKVISMIFFLDEEGKTDQSKINGWKGQL